VWAHVNSVFLCCSHQISCYFPCCLPRLPHIPLQSGSERVIYIIESLFILARNLTVPVVEEDGSYNRFFLCLCPVFLGPFLIFLFGRSSVNLPGFPLCFCFWPALSLTSIRKANRSTMSRRRGPACCCGRCLLLAFWSRCG
jgi:hypothetical protein